MKGGYQILDLRDVSLELSSETQNFTNTNILKQLRNLREYIEKGFSFSKGLDNSLKPVLIRYRDGKAGEKQEFGGFANITASNDSLTYEIKCKDLMIEVVFEEKTDEAENKYFDIKTAKYLYNHNLIVEGSVVASGLYASDLKITDDAEVVGDLVVGGSINGEENPSVKPIYCHPIHITLSHDSALINCRISCLIFNNDDTPFTKASLKSSLLEGTIRLVCTGGAFVKATEKTVIVSYIFGNGSNLFIMGMTTTGDVIQSGDNLNFGDILDNVNTSLDDGVNKIN